MTAWQHLSWSHAALIALSVVLVVTAGLVWLLAPRDTADRTWWPTADYSQARARAIARLGTRYLLHTPINRRVQ